MVYFEGRARVGIMLSGRCGDDGGCGGSGGDGGNLTEMMPTTRKYRNATNYCYSRDERAMQTPMPGFLKDIRSLHNTTPKVLT